MNHYNLINTNVIKGRKVITSAFIFISGYYSAVAFKSTTTEIFRYNMVYLTN